MPVPKRKTGRMRTHSRRAANNNIKLIQTVPCPQCGAPKLPHHVCPNCGTYKGRQVIEVEG